MASAYSTVSTSELLRFQHKEHENLCASCARTWSFRSHWPKSMRISRKEALYGLLQHAASCNWNRFRLKHRQVWRLLCFWRHSLTVPEYLCPPRQTPYEYRRRKTKNMPQLKCLFGISTVWHWQVKEYQDKPEITVSVLHVRSSPGLYPHTHPKTP